MITSPRVYSENDNKTIVFKKEDSGEARLHSVFRHAFGDAYARLEDLDAHRCCLHLRQGWLREVRR